MAEALRKACLEGPVPFGPLPASVPGTRWSSRLMEMLRSGVQGTPGRVYGGRGCVGEAAWGSWTSSWTWMLRDERGREKAGLKGACEGMLGGF